MDHKSGLHWLLSVKLQNHYVVMCSSLSSGPLGVLADVPGCPNQRGGIIYFLLKSYPSVTQCLVIWGLGFHTLSVTRHLKGKFRPNVWHLGQNLRGSVFTTLAKVAKRVQCGNEHEQLDDLDVWVQESSNPCRPSTKHIWKDSQTGCKQTPRLATLICCRERKPEGDI